MREFFLPRPQVASRISPTACAEGVRSLRRRRAPPSFGRRFGLGVRCAALAALERLDNEAENARPVGEAHDDVERLLKVSFGERAFAGQRRQGQRFLAKRGFSPAASGLCAGGSSPPPHDAA